MAFTGQYSGQGIDITLKASAAVEKWKYVTIASQDDGECVQCSSAGEIAVGIAQKKATAAGQEIPVRVFGISKCIAGAAVTKAVALQADGDGECIAATTADEVLGMALEAAAAANDVITVTVGYGGIF